MSRDFNDLIRLWIDSYGDEILRLSKVKLVEIANQCIDAELVPNMAPVKLNEGARLMTALRNALAEDLSAELKADEHLPKLSGTEIQVRWAEIIRRDAIINARKLIQQAIRRRDIQAAKQLEAGIGEILRKETRAKWFIDNRPDQLESIHKGKVNLRWFFEISSPEEEAACNEMSIKPPNMKNLGIAEVYASNGGMLSVRIRDSSIIRILRCHNMKLDSAMKMWRCELEQDKNAVDQIETLARELLEEGYEVIVSDGSAREKAEQNELILDY